MFKIKCWEKVRCIHPSHSAPMWGKCGYLSHSILVLFSKDSHWKRMSWSSVWKSIHSTALFWMGTKQSLSWVYLIFFPHYKAVLKITWVSEKEPKLWSYKDLASVTTPPWMSCLTSCLLIHLSKPVFSDKMGPRPKLKNCCEEEMSLWSSMQGLASGWGQVPKWWYTLRYQLC